MTVMNRDLRRLLHAAEAQGWTIRKGSKHFQLFSPDGETIITVGGTPSDPRTKKNLRAMLKRAGVEGV